MQSNLNSCNDMSKIASEYKTFFCRYCDIHCRKKHDWERHLNTVKHQKNKLNNGNSTTPLVIHICSCGRKYKYLSGLSKHKKKCDSNKSLLTPLVEQNKEFITTLITQNDEFKQMIVDQNNKILDLVKESNNKVVHHTINHNTHTTTMNTTNHFNLQFFLNVQCKDALNIMDFINSLQLQIKDLEDTGRLGYVDGISKILINGLKELDITKRPIHCSDLKRETIYIKDADIWEKEDEQKDKLTKAIKNVSYKNIIQLPLWQQLNPQYNNLNSKFNDTYIKIVGNVMTGTTEEENNRNYKKIISKVAKQVVIDKDNM
jgi:hypothetical protein